MSCYTIFNYTCYISHFNTSVFNFHKIQTVGIFGQFGFSNCIVQVSEVER